MNQLMRKKVQLLDEFQTNVEVCKESIESHKSLISQLDREREYLLDMQSDHNINKNNEDNISPYMLL